MGEGHNDARSQADVDQLGACANASQEQHRRARATAQRYKSADIQSQSERDDQTQAGRHQQCDLATKGDRHDNRAEN